ncbi:MAG: aspartate aminotransferase family protein [Candidatus Omnitrophica bacterium]|nr:aspartate aminotransferase family protein [Candidatus Omnitrophota bacterium]
MKSEEVITLYKNYVMPTYVQTPLVLSKGKGAYVWDCEGRAYLDFFPGWAVSGLGHCHPKVVRAIRKQSGTIIHVSNNYLSELQGRLAELIIKSSFDGKVFFANSGAEANEGAIKLARRYGNPTKKYEIITMEKSFHGRTMACISATGQEKVKIGFEPLLEGFKIVPFNNLSAVQEAVSNKTIAILVEPIQGEGGINIASREYLLGLRKLCDEKDLLLIFDEVQTGIGRTGKLFCFQNFGVKPDIMTLAKSLGSGVPIGAIVASRRICDILGPGSHATTFGGSPLVCSAGIATFEAIKSERLLENVNVISKFLFSKLDKLKKKHPSLIKEIRGMGIMVGIELNIEGEEIVKQCREEGLLINCTQKNVLRIMPPLVVKRGEVAKAIKIFDNVLTQIEKDKRL